MMACVNTDKRDACAANHYAYNFGKTAKTKKAIVKLTEDSADIEIFQGL